MVFEASIAVMFREVVEGGIDRQGASGTPVTCSSLNESWFRGYIHFVAMHGSINLHLSIILHIC